MMEEKPVLGVIGGSGLYNMPGLEGAGERQIDTPFGKPSAPVITGRLDGVPVAFLARHGLGHTLSPSEVNYRANIYALKSLGVERVLAVSACGSLSEEIHPGDIVIPDGLFDFTRLRQRSFFTDGLVAHVSVADPFCHHFSKAVWEACTGLETRRHWGGSFITIEGPRFSTKTESNLFRSWNMSIIGMTTSPEAFLAREAELCYSVMAHVTDYDVWHVSEETVTVQQVIQVLHRNTQAAQQAIRQLAASLDGERACDCGQALSTALITHPGAFPPEARQRLGLLVDKYLG